ncbi:hypothetical protein DEU56DRAFT_836062 [Suillus clintonianus]|uniref:uncharacterized protein n=1 Tax=Suillus clintonianus TaxID=1904413 RepID=UPI001B864B85|nr:uncharacterized protein DEU56DRAFT_836062 [Suillus clintonianus]KAG2120035.1 hypothetical protein DEU56DRAFT_836062 [Suillus clintonianus]
MLKRNLINLLAYFPRSVDQQRKLEWIDIDALSFTNSHVPPSSTKYPEPPIHRLPVELLQHIFLLIVNDAPDFPSIFSCGETTISANFASPPLVFTRVCCLWRAIALSTTGVWSRFQVALPGRFSQLHPFLPHLLQFWLACSGRQPLTLRTCQDTSLIVAQRCYYSKADSQLLRVLLSARDRWESAGVMSPIHDHELVRYRHTNSDLRLGPLGKIAAEWRFPGNGEIEVPQLRTLECYWSDITKFDAPNLTRRLYLESYPYPTSHFPTPTCNNIRNLHLQKASAHIIRSTPVIFPHLEAIVVDAIELDGGRSDSAVCSSLESMTLPLSSDNQHRKLIVFWRRWRLHLATCRW